MKKVDVIINVYGKPWQTLCTLKSLLKHSEQHIDKIYFIKEKEQPYNENIDWIESYFTNLVVFQPSDYSFITFNLNSKSEQERFKVRYQFGIESSDKKYVFVTHNDVLYSGDIIGEMLEQIGSAVGIGELGQCWNCPAKHIGICSGEKFNEWNPTLQDIESLPLPHIRTSRDLIDFRNLKPLPECRLNEWACLLDRETIMKECKPNGTTSLFGQYGIDLGTRWFKEMYIKGYNFVDYRKNFKHSYWSEVGNGYQTQLNLDLYKKSEIIAENYFKENFL